MHAHIPNPKFMVMAETSTFSIFCGRNVRGRNVQAEMSVAEMFEHRGKLMALSLEILIDFSINVTLLKCTYLFSSPEKDFLIVHVSF